MKKSANDILRSIDKYIGALIVPLLWPLKSRSVKKRPKRVLLIKLWALGDSVLTLTLLRAINECMGIKADVMCTANNKVIYENNPLVNKILSPRNAIGRLKDYDVVFDAEPYFNISAILASLLGKSSVGFSGQWRSMLYTRKVLFDKKQHMVQNYLDMARILGCAYDTKTLEPLEVDKQERVENFLKGYKKMLIGITPGTGPSAKNRMWYTSRFARLADKIMDNLHADVVFIDSPQNKSVVKSIISQMEHKPLNAAGRFQLEESIFLIEQCDIFISNDTGPMHIAAAQGCRTIGLFGPNTPVLWGPYGKNNIALYKTKLQPCIQNDKGIFPDRDRKGYMGPITVDDVYEVVKKLAKHI